MAQLQLPRYQVKSYVGVIEAYLRAVHWNWDLPPLPTPIYDFIYGSFDHNLLSCCPKAILVFGLCGCFTAGWRSDVCFVYMLDLFNAVLCLNLAFFPVFHDFLFWYFASDSYNFLKQLSVFLDLKSITQNTKPKEGVKWRSLQRTVFQPGSLETLTRMMLKTVCKDSNPSKMKASHDVWIRKHFCSRVK